MSATDTASWRRESVLLCVETEGRVGIADLGVPRLL
jgi:hypothetical protein